MSAQPPTAAEKLTSSELAEGSDSDILASVVDQFELNYHPGESVLRRFGGRETGELLTIDRAGPPPTRHDLINVQRAEKRRWPLDHCRVHLGNLDIECGDPMTNGCFIVELLDRGELLLHSAKQLERWRQCGDLLVLDKLLHPPERVVFLGNSDFFMQILFGLLFLMLPAGSVSPNLKVRALGSRPAWRSGPMAWQPADR